RIARQDGLGQTSAIKLGQELGGPGHQSRRNGSRMFVTAKNRAAKVLALSLGQCFERFENQLPRGKFHVAAHLIEIEARIDQGAIEVEDDAANWHVTWPRSPGPAGATPAQR